MNNIIIFICGESGTGKDYLAHKIQKKTGFEIAKSCTNRPMRENERDGEEHYFLSKKEMESLIYHGLLIENQKYETILNGNKETWYYGIKKDEIDLNKNGYIVILDLKSLDNFKRVFGKDNVIPFCIYAKDSIKKKRAIKRGSFCEKEWERRLKDDKKVYDLDNVLKNKCFIIVNENFFDVPVRKMLKIIKNWKRGQQ